MNQGKLRQIKDFTVAKWNKYLTHTVAFLQIPNYLLLNCEKMSDEEVLKICVLQNGNINNNVTSSRYLSKHLELKIYLDTRYADIPENFFSYREVIWRIKNNIEKRPLCKSCGGNVDFIGKQSWENSGKTKNGYLIYCSTKCSNSDEIVKKKVKETCIKKYGVDSPIKNKDVRKKFSKTMVDLYGVENALENKEILKKYRETCKEHYGEYSPSKSKEIKDKTKQTNLLKYGVIAPACCDEILKKIENTNIKKYGNKCFLKTDEFKTLFENNKEEWLCKIQESLIRNGTINKSEPENKLKEFLVKIFGNDDVVHQYKSKEYPFLCDFFIKSKKLYIEYQGTYFHNKCFYNKDRDKEKLTKLLEKKDDERHPSYKRIINIWTKRDVSKFNTAKENNINIIFIYPNWSNEWIKLLKKQKKYSEDIIINELKLLIENCLENNKQSIVGECYD